jgi:lysophospholipase L1-like esterase
MFRRWHVAVLAVLAVLALACEGTGGANSPGGGGGGASANGLPSSIAALGDSITAGYGSCLTVVACTHNSWSTGTSGSVESHYRRLVRDNPKIRDKRRNYAVPGARAAGLKAQADKAVRAKAQYVTILIGANDACRGTVDEMTEPETFRSQVDAALDRLGKGLPTATVLVVSIPDLHRLWEVGHTNDRAVAAWARGICPALLADPRSTAEADTRRRRAVDRRVDAYNRELGRACRAYGRKCRYDEGAAHRVRFTLAQVSERDYFHPDVQGQHRLAEATYPRRWR